MWVLLRLRLRDLRTSLRSERVDSIRLFDYFYLMFIWLYCTVFYSILFYLYSILFYLLTLDCFCSTLCSIFNKVSKSVGHLVDFSLSVEAIVHFLHFRTTPLHAPHTIALYQVVANTSIHMYYITVVHIYHSCTRKTHCPLWQCHCPLCCPLPTFCVFVLTIALSSDVYQTCTVDRAYNELYTFPFWRKKLHAIKSYWCATFTIRYLGYSIADRFP